MWVILKKKKFLLELNKQLKVRLSKILKENPVGALPPVVNSLETLSLWYGSLIFDSQSPLGRPFHLYIASSVNL